MLWLSWSFYLLTKAAITKIDHITWSDVVTVATFSIITLKFKSSEYNKPPNGHNGLHYKH